jgi:hypothetical protein
MNSRTSLSALLARVFSSPFGCNLVLDTLLAHQSSDFVRIRDESFYGKCAAALTHTMILAAVQGETLLKGQKNTGKQATKREPRKFITNKHCQPPGYFHSV